MSDDHGQASHSGDKKGSNAKNMSDDWLQKIQDYISGGISRFVAFLFFLITIGAILGYVVAQRGEGEFMIFLPAAAGLLAYYNRDFALAVLVIVAVVIFL